MGGIILKQIEKYVNSIYKNVAGNKEEIEDLKQEMRSHLIEAVEELKTKGETEDEAIRIAIENFGGKNQMVKGLSEFFKVQKKFTNYVVSFALAFLCLGIFFIPYSLSELNEFNKEVKKLEVVETEKEIIMNDIFDVVDNSNKVTEKGKEQLLAVFDKHKEKLNLLAVFPAANSKKWLENNEYVKVKPVTRFPIEYSKAIIVIGDNDIIENKEQIVPSDYDLGTVVKANEQWIVQYEYKASYEKTIEKHHQLKHYGPSTWSFYQFPILFFSLFIVLGVVWLFLRKHNKILKRIKS